MADEEISVIPPLDIPEPQQQPAARTSPVKSDPLSYYRQVYNQIHNKSGFNPVNFDVANNVTGDYLTGPNPAITRGEPEAYSNSVADMLRSQDWAKDPYSYGQTTSFGAGERDLNFDRYYSHPGFKKLGFSPTRDNEMIFNTQTPFWTDYVRAAPQFLNLVWGGLKDMESEWFDYGFKPDTKMADTMTRAMSIGNSTRGGVTGWVTNFGVNMGYTVGIIAALAAEELALTAATAALVDAPATVPLMAARATRGAGKIWEAFGAGLTVAQRASKIAEQARQLFNIKSMTDAARAFDVAKFGKRGLEFINPLEHSTKYLAEVGTMVGKNGEKLSQVAKNARGVVALFRDARVANAVFSESKFEGGSRKIDQTQELMDNYYALNGKLPEGEEADNISKIASDAAFYDSMANVPLIYLTDKIVFDTAFKGMKIFTKTGAEAGAAEVAAGEIGGTIITDYKYAAKGLPKAVRMVGKYSKDAFKYYLSPKNLANNFMKTTLTYTGKNLTQGIQENLQDVIQDTLKDYYGQVYKDPLLANMSASFGKGLMGQLSAQGLNTFISGYLMGAVIQGGEKQLFNTLPSAIKRVTNKKGWAEFKSTRETYIKNYLETKNDIIMNGGKYEKVLSQKDKKGPDGLTISPMDENYVKQLHINKSLNEGLHGEDVRTGRDLQEESVYHHVHRLLESGQIDSLHGIIQDWESMTPAELAQAWNQEEGKDDTGRDIKARLKGFKENVTMITNLWEDSVKNVKNPVTFRDEVTLGKSASDYKQAFENYRKLSVFANFKYLSASGRVDSIYRHAQINGSPLKDVPAFEFSALYSPRDMNNNIQMLKADLQVLAGLDDAQSKKDRDRKDKRLVSLLFLRDEIAKYQKAIKDGNKQNAVETGNDKYDLRPLRKAYGVYVKLMAGEHGVPMLESDVDRTFLQIKDLYPLMDDTHQWGDAVNVLSDSEYAESIIQHIRDSHEVAKANWRELTEEGLREYIKMMEGNKVLELIHNEGVFLLPEQAERLMKFEVVDWMFLDITTKKIIDTTSPKYVKLVSIINDFYESNNKPTSAPVAPAAPAPAAPAGPGTPPGTPPAGPVPVNPNASTIEFSSLDDTTKAKLEALLKSINATRPEGPLTMEELLDNRPKEVTDILTGAKTVPTPIVAAKQPPEEGELSVSTGPTFDTTEIDNALKKLNAKTFKVDLSDSDYYLDENGKQWKRISTLKDEYTGPESDGAERGTIIDDMYRASRALKDSSVATLKALYKTSYDKIAQEREDRRKLDPDFNPTYAIPVFSEEFFQNLSAIFKMVDESTEGYKLITNLPTLWGKLKDKDGELKDFAGTVDMLLINDKKEIYIIDLKTSTLDRREDYDKPAETSIFKKGDSIQQSAYAELLRQVTDGVVSAHSVATFPIQTTKTNGVYTKAKLNRKKLFFKDLQIGDVLMTSNNVYTIKDIDPTDESKPVSVVSTNIDGSNPVDLPLKGSDVAAGLRDEKGSSVAGITVTNRGGILSLAVPFNRAIFPVKPTVLPSAVTLERRAKEQADLDKAAEQVKQNKIAGIERRKKETLKGLNKTVRYKDGNVNIFERIEEDGVIRSEDEIVDGMSIVLNGKIGTIRQDSETGDWSWTVAPIGRSGMSKSELFDDIFRNKIKKGKVVEVIDYDAELAALETKPAETKSSGKLPILPKFFISPGVGAVVYFPSAMGKTTLVKQHPDQLADADQILHDYLKTADNGEVWRLIQANNDSNPQYHVNEENPQNAGYMFDMYKRAIKDDVKYEQIREGFKQAVATEQHKGKVVLTANKTLLDSANFAYTVPHTVKNSKGEDTLSPQTYAMTEFRKVRASPYLAHARPNDEKGWAEDYRKILKGDEEVLATNKNLTEPVDRESLTRYKSIKAILTGKTPEEMYEAEPSKTVQNTIDEINDLLDKAVNEKDLMKIKVLSNELIKDAPNEWGKVNEKIAERSMDIASRLDIQSISKDSVLVLKGKDDVAQALVKVIFKGGSPKGVYIKVAPMVGTESPEELIYEKDFADRIATVWQWGVKVPQKASVITREMIEAAKESIPVVEDSEANPVETYVKIAEITAELEKENPDEIGFPCA